MDERGEWIGSAGYLLSTTGIEALVDSMGRSTTWEPAELDEVADGWSLQWFARPPGARRDDAPSTHPDSMIIVVAPERHTGHVADYRALGWVLGRKERRDDGSWMFLWRSQRYKELLQLLAAGQASPPSPLPPVPTGAYASPLLAQHSADSRPGASWESTVQSGTRAGAMAAFLDGITDGGFFDF